jgi:hypothetical protein
MNRREFFKRSATLVGGAVALLFGVKPKTVAASPAFTLANLKEAKTILDAADVPKENRMIWVNGNMEQDEWGRITATDILDAQEEYSREIGKALAKNLDRRIMESMK